MGWFQRLNEGLGRTRHVVQQSLDRFLGRAPDEELLEDLEAALLAADLGARAVDRLIRQVREETRGADAKTSEGVQNVLSRSLYSILKTVSGPTIDQLVTEGSKPFVTLVPKPN